MKALVTGINGFVGPYLKKYLLENNFEVVGTDIKEGNNVNKVDLLDKEQVTNLIKEVVPDFIFHLAAQSSVELSWKNPELTRNVNVNGTKNLLDAIKIHNKDARILIISSCDVYGIPESVPIKEDAPLAPVSPYGKSRLEQEKLVLSSELKTIISRSFSHTGPGQAENFVCSYFAKQIAEIEKGKEPIISTGNLDIKRDFADVRDIVKAYFLALEKCSTNEIYNICSGRSYAIKNILEILLSMTDKKIKIETDPAKLRKADIPELVGDNSKFINTTSWKPEIPIETTLKDILDYWRENITQ